MSEYLMAIDVGNTETAVGLFREGQLLRHWRISTDVRRTPDELAYLLRRLADDAGLGSELKGVIGSVVPPIEPILIRGFRRAFASEARLISNPTELLTGDFPVRLEVDDPSSVGADRVFNTLAATLRFGVDTIVVDLGTATNFDCITADGAYIGGVISPGPRSGMEGLAHRARKLPFIELVPPEGVIGRRTEACLISGCFYAIVDAIDGMVIRIKEEWDRKEVLVVGAGGLAGLIAPHCASVDLIEPYLTLYGLEIADRLFDETPSPD